MFENETVELLPARTTMTTMNGGGGNGGGGGGRRRNTATAIAAIVQFANTGNNSDVTQVNTGDATAVAVAGS
ncbi:hypothetical protein DQ238_08995 [Geodermatophilus sp. TF02-6]|uniref:hypothetical protein n=1 Tax=Geodermatophilus sp. TF02-6 TaxID=2250575 RepID=UPI000DE95DEF|nr:hypothetical protein [Geodermatophilus sp. TF02-6]RBY79775.1 hypothetical protein DQ238_08995 [Geodermatophilus sp. TF02-6]